MSAELGPMSRIFDGPAGEGDNEAHKTSNSVDVSDEHKCEVQDVRDKEAWDYETGNRRLSAVEEAKREVSRFCVRGRGRSR